MTGIFGNMVPVTHVSMCESISPKTIKNLGTCPQNFANNVPGRKSLQNIGLKGRRIISLPGAPTYLGPTLYEVCTDYWFIGLNCIQTTVGLVLDLLESTCSVPRHSVARLLSISCLGLRRLKPSTSTETHKSDQE